jgi:hypothetical protein
LAAQLDEQENDEGEQSTNSNKDDEADELNAGGEGKKKNIDSIIQNMLTSVSSASVSSCPDKSPDDGSSSKRKSSSLIQEIG